MKNYIISIVSKDRAGIVARATRAIYALGGDVADVKQTLMYGYFTMTLGTQFASDVSIDTLQAKIIEQSDNQGWEVLVKGLDRNHSFTEVQPIQDCYVVTVRGHNRSGIVNGVSEVLAHYNINILDLETKLHNGMYVLATQVDIADANCDLSAFKAGLQEFADTNNMKVTVQHRDIFRATNEIRM